MLARDCLRRLRDSFAPRLGRVVGLPALVVAFAGLTACSRTPLVRVATAPLAEGPPELERVVDLGGLDLPGTGVVSEASSDGIVTPGEWLALEGPGLAAPDAIVRFGTRTAAVQGYTQSGGLLVRVPRGLSNPVALSIETRAGRTVQSLAVESHIVVADVGDQELRIWRTPDTSLGEEVSDVPLRGLRANLLSHDGAFLYAASHLGAAGNATPADKYRLLVMHLGAPNAPAVAKTWDVQLASAPTALALSDDDRSLFVLSESSLAVFDLEARTRLRPRGQLSFPGGTDGKRSLRSLVVLDGGRRLAVLDSLSDEVMLLDTTQAPKLTQKLNLKPSGAAAGSPPTAIELAADATDPGAFWVLQGVNSRWAGELMKVLSSGLRLLPGLVAGSGESVATPDTPSWPSPRLRHFATSGAEVHEKNLIELPSDFMPLHLARGPGSALWVSGLASDWSRTKLDPGRILSSLVATPSIGHVLEVDPAGHISTRLRGLLLVLQLTTRPSDDSPLYTGMRLGPELLPPGLAVDWVAESYQRQTVRLRSMEWTSLRPPYLPPSVIAQ